MSVDINLPDEQAEYHDVLGQLTEETSQGRSSLYKGTDAQRSTSSAMNVCIFICMSKGNKFDSCSIFIINIVICLFER